MAAHRKSKKDRRTRGSRTKKKTRAARLEEKRANRKKQDPSAALVTAVLIGVLVAFLIGRDDAPEVSPTYQAQLSQLAETERSLVSLQKFVSQQAEEIGERERTLDALQEENKSLGETVERNRAQIYAVLDTYKAHQRRDIWVERSVAFFIGLLSSYLVTLSFRLWTSRRNVTAKIAGSASEK